MELDLIGRLNNTILHPSKALYPLFECIINSIHSIEDLKNGKDKGYIEIIIERDESQYLISKDIYEDLRPIKSFTIIDNGIGFNESNFQSFRTGDSRLKQQKGSKGIGRFVWLKAFKSVKINSVFSGVDKKKYERDFEFKISESGIENHTLNPINDKSTKTIINLINFIPDYQKNCPKNINDIALKIIDHCLVYFLYDNCPTITIKDPVNDLEIVINDLFNANKKDHIKEIEFDLKGEGFKLNILELYANTGKSNKLHFCSNMREVKNYNLSSLIPDLSKSLNDENGNDFFIRAYVTGTFLDKIVNPERTALSFPEAEERDPFRIQTITEEDLKEKVAEEIQNALSEYLLEIWEDKMEFVTDFIQNEAPQFRSLLKYKSKKIENLKPISNKRVLDLELYKILQDLEYEVKEQYFEITEELEDEKNEDEYQKKYDEYIEKVIDVGSAKLSQYIIHRKTILDILSKQLELNEDGKYNLENSIHQIIFPLKSTSDDISYDKQNLWIIDEKLSYHKYLASDLPFNQMNKDIVDNDSVDRPDVVIFNSPIALVNNDPPYQSIVILEFKRPMRKAFSEEKNPIEQIYGYIRKIHERKGLDNKGRIIQGVTPSTPSYCYLVCDITPKIAEIAENSDFTSTPDNLGYFGFNKKLNAYIEIISYQKMVNDAKQRNRILFEKLNLPNI